MSVEVIVPYRAGCPYRQAALNWVVDRYRAWCPGWDVNVVVDVAAGPWVKARLVNPAVRSSAADVVVVADADCWSPGTVDAVNRVAGGRAGWAVPHAFIHRFNRDFTARVVAEGDVPEYTSVLLEERSYEGRPGGGIVVGCRDVLADVPMDPRFEGWGGEDVSWGMALRALHGRPWFAGQLLWHLWHPPQERDHRGTLPAAAHDLTQRYYLARSSRQRMRALLDEAR